MSEARYDAMNCAETIPKNEKAPSAAWMTPFWRRADEGDWIVRRQLTTRSDR